MTNENLNKLCMDESDPMLKEEDFGLAHAMVDKEEVDLRSSFIIPRLVNKINELEQELCIRQVHIDNLRNSNLLLERRLNRSGGSSSDGANGVFYTYKRKKPYTSSCEKSGLAESTSISSSVALSAVAVLKGGVVVKEGEVEKVATGSSLFKWSLPTSKLKFHSH
ncbi:hypothetical protein H5410_060344 [Solanum commersonii]|uniref:Uncharacterized protein n=1 Tax=Solanum commersonii TaxID=4109 RepID=A0A9J5W4Y9_SOLCO|nr:hypothetical protein H5410_060344 [Solanum commersonii]